MTHNHYQKTIPAIMMLFALCLMNTGCELLLPEKTSEALDFSCEGCHTDKTLIQSLASSEVEVPEGGG
jgi:hypothetical protein